MKNLRTFNKALKLGTALLLGLVLFSPAAVCAEDVPLLTGMQATTDFSEYELTEDYLKTIIHSPLPASPPNQVDQAIRWNDVIAKTKRGFLGATFGEAYQTRLHKQLHLFLGLSSAQLAQQLAMAEFKEKEEHLRVKTRLFETGNQDIYPVQKAKIALLQAHQQLTEAYHRYQAVQSSFKSNEDLNETTLKASDNLVVVDEDLLALEELLSSPVASFSEESSVVSKAVREHTSFIERLLSDKKEDAIAREARKAFFNLKATSTGLVDATYQDAIADKALAQRHVSVKAGSSSQSELRLTVLEKEKIAIAEKLALLNVVKNKIDLWYAIGDLTPSRVFTPPFKH